MGGLGFMEILAIVLMLCIVVLCLAGSVSEHYHDNWLQRLGMSVVGVTMVARIGLVVQDAVAAPQSVLLYAGILAFGIGVLVKVRRYARKGAHGTQT